MHCDYALCKSIYIDCVIKIDKIKLFANLGAKPFQETGGLSRWQELINNEKKKKRKLVFCLRGSRRHSKKNRVQFGMQ